VSPFESLPDEEGSPEVGSSRVRPRRLRRALTLAGLLLCLLLLYLVAPRLTSGKWLQTDDYVEYWAAGRLNLSGANPYSPEELTPVEHLAGRYFQVPVMMWNPPYTLVIAMPLAWLPYPVSRLTWLILNVALLLLGAEWTWRVYGGPQRYRWLVWLLCLVFIPSLGALGSGQIAILPFVGAAGFLFYQREGKLWQSGMIAALTAVKPHSLYLFWVILVVWALSRRRWPVLLGAVGALVLGTAIASLFNPSLVGQYLHATTTFPMRDWATPTLGGLLRLVFGTEKGWLQFAAAPVGLIWALWWWRKYRFQWEWSEQMPMLVAVSLVTAAYGWSCDLAVFLVAILQVAAGLTRMRDARMTALVFGSYAVIIGLSAAQYGRLTDFWFMWLAPALLAWYLFARRLIGAALPGRPEMSQVTEPVHG
jgi:hypothetical protein